MMVKFSYALLLILLLVDIVAEALSGHNDYRGGRSIGNVDGGRRHGVGGHIGGGSADLRRCRGLHNCLGLDRDGDLDWDGLDGFTKDGGGEPDRNGNNGSLGWDGGGLPSGGAGDGGAGGGTSVLPRHRIRRYLGVLQPPNMSGFFCGDSLLECGVYLNLLLPQRLYVDYHRIHAHRSGRTGPTRAQELRADALRTKYDHLQVRLLYYLD